MYFYRLISHVNMTKKVRQWARCVHLCLAVCPGFLVLQCDRAKSLLRNAESRKRRVATPLLLPQPKAGMHRGAGRDIVLPGCSDAQAAPQPRAPPAPTHSLLRSSFTERKSTVELRRRKNVSQGRAPHTVVVHPAMTKLHTGLCLLSTQN